MSAATQTRLDQLSANLTAVRARVGAAESAAGRPAGDVSLIVVTKFFPAADVRLLSSLGVTSVGENRHQEAEEKALACADLDLRWHFIGGLQTNKAAAVGRYADVVESVDRERLIAPLGRGAAEAGRQVDVLLQVSLDAAETDVARSGASPEQLDRLAEQVNAQPALRLRGLMAVAPLGEEPDAAFERLAAIRQRFVENWPDAMVLSAGMSGDLEQAVVHGATHVRVGSAILGTRQQVL